MAAGDPKPADPRIARALELLAEAAQERMRRHPQGHLAAGVRDTLELSLPLPVAPGALEVGTAAEHAEEALARAVEGLVHHRAVFRPGGVYCLRCASAECEHARLPSARATFAGYGPSGVPRYCDFAQWLVERRDPRAGDLYTAAGGSAPSRVVAVAASGEELAAGVLPVFQDRGADYRLHGQVTAGWYRAADAHGHPAPLAVTFQVVSSRPAGNRRRLGLNLLVRGPAGEAVDTLFDRRGEIPWQAEARWAQTVLASIEEGLTKRLRKGARKGGEGTRAQARAQAEQRAEARIEGLLKNLARRLEKGGRARDRRTRHAEERHGQGDRPTRMALADLAQAKDEDVLLDTRRSTFVVVGDRGRAHVFNRRGKLVTSVRYSPEAIERRRELGRWQPLPKDEVEALRTMVAGGQGG